MISLTKLSGLVERTKNTNMVLTLISGEKIDCNNHSDGDFLDQLVRRFSYVFKLKFIVSRR